MMWRSILEIAIQLQMNIQVLVKTAGGQLLAKKLGSIRCNRSHAQGLQASCHDRIIDRPAVKIHSGTAQSLHKVGIDDARMGIGVQPVGACLL